ncbi:hypothetical protein [Methylobacterium goesingense]|uniref:Uncharacterized protein n=1 Tax=Methylobacterium goesingense TaxID=243690 RepID=A0ABV2LBT8_9HYPH|nr:hypothetical protein [Methylobacterium goesingense]GJD73612.1 hypothetical protein CFIICLFH_1841 [Methylobacterium goesingense]
MITHASFLKQIQPAVEELRDISQRSKGSFRSEYIAVSHFYSCLDNAFVPNWQYDLDVQEELRSLLKRPPVVAVTSALAGAVECLASLHRRDPSDAGWQFLDFLDDVSAAGAVGGLDAPSAHFLRLAAYCAVVVHGTPGAALPDLPLSPETETVAPEFRHPRIHLSHVPGRPPRGPYGDEGQVASGLPDDTNDPKGSGWGV